LHFKLFVKQIVAKPIKEIRPKQYRQLKSLIKYGVGVFALVLAHTCFGQTSIDSLYRQGICDGSGFCIPKLSGLPKSKGFEIKYKRVLNYKIETEHLTESYSDFIDRDRELTIKLKIPLLLRDNLKLILGAKYENEVFRFDDLGPNANEFYKALNNKPLKSVGGTLYALKPFKGNKYLLGRFGMRWSGDFGQELGSEYGRLSVSAIYGIRARSDLSWGAGITYSYTFGRQLIFPVLAYSRKYDNGFDFEGLLPVYVKVRKQFSAKNILQFENRISGDSYNIRFQSLSDEDQYLAKSDLFTTLSYEREILSFLWLSAGVSNRYNINFDISENNTFRTRGNPQYQNRLADALSYEFSLFIVPPK